MKTVEINGNQYEVSGYAADGLPIIKARVETSEDGVDADGNPVRSVRVTVPPVTIGATPGKVA